MMKMIKDDPQWIAAREALWESRVKKELLQDFRKKDLKTLKAIYLGDLYPEFVPKKRGEPCEYFDLWSDREAPSYVGFFLWPNQSLEFWKRYHEEYFLNRGREWREYLDFSVDPRRYGWDEETEREWTLTTLASLFKGFVPEARDPIFHLPQNIFPGTFLVWASHVFDYVAGTLYLRVDGAHEERWSISHDDRAVLSTEWMLKSLLRMPESYFSENPTEDELLYEGDAERGERFRRKLRSILWLTINWEKRYANFWKGGIVNVEYRPFPVGDDYERKVDFIKGLHAGLAEIPAAAALLERAKNPKWKR